MYLMWNITFTLYMNVWLNLAAALYVDLLIVSLSSVSSVSELQCKRERVKESLIPTQR